MSPDPRSPRCRAAGRRQPGRRPRRVVPKLALLLASLATAAAGSSPPPVPLSPETAPPGFALNGDAAHGRALFAANCILCHGEGGAGDGRMSSYLDPPPGDLTDPERMASRSDWTIYRAIRDGGSAVGRSPVMPAFGEELDGAELLDLATYLRSLAPVDETPADEPTDGGGEPGESAACHVHPADPGAARHVAPPGDDFPRAPG